MNYKRVAIMVIGIMLVGFIGPWLISAPNTFAVLGGVVLIVLYVWYVVSYVIKQVNLQKKGNTDENHA